MSGCERTGALALVQQQLFEAKGLDDVSARIKILIRAAELLWTLQPETARNAFKDAYDLAEQSYREQGDERRSIKGSDSMMMIMPDQRFTVISAIARRDAAWAKSLLERLAGEKRAEAEDEATAQLNRNNDLRMNEKLLNLAADLASVDKQGALNFARGSFRYPASWNGLPRFLYSLAEIDRALADQFYLEALRFYSGRPISEFLYLSAYPFALSRFVGPEANAFYETPPKGFRANAVLQQQFMDALLARAQKNLDAPALAVSGSSNLPESAQIYLALENLEPLIERDLPAMAERVEVMKNSLNEILSTEARRQAERLNQEQRETDQPSFSNLMERVERETNSAKRDYMLTQAVMAGVGTESLERLEKLAQKLDDESVRRQLLNWLYFVHSQKAARAGVLDEAARLARKVEEIDQRAYLHFEIAAQAEKRFKDMMRVREALDEAAVIALSAPNTDERARTLLGVAHLYAKFDKIRAAEVMSDAVKTINRLEKPDFEFTAVFQQIKGKEFGIYLAYPVAGFDLENALRELALTDFQGALGLASALNNKPLRATTVIALAAQCLEKQPRKKNQEKR
ncbi:MAG TPA: hypothetical protein VF791_24345 [Pyrinomonadaceae bacterium]